MQRVCKCDWCMMQVLCDVLWLRERRVRHADVAKESSLAASLQVLPLESFSGWCPAQLCAGLHGWLVLRSRCSCLARIHLQIY